jgi:succinyl-CoA synthetase alpha subunit
MTVKQVRVIKDSYYDSVFLMQVSRQAKAVPGVQETNVLLGTQANLQLLDRLGYPVMGALGITSHDLMIAIQADDAGVAERGIAAVRQLLHQTSGATLSSSYQPSSLETAVKLLPGANLALISLPGSFAAAEAARALELGLHVMLFSDNVSLADEIRLKQRAAKLGLLVMGPDCGTALINGKPLGFANVVRRGRIGIVGASGTGIQEVSCCIDRLGEGISQALGTGGRDLQEAVGGSTMLAGIEALSQDPETAVLVVVSKPPAPAVAKRVVAALRSLAKPCVAHFVGQEAGKTEAHLLYAGNLKEAAAMAVALAQQHSYQSPRPKREELIQIATVEANQLAPGQKYLRGLYTGGTLADEAWFHLHRLGEIHANLPVPAELVIEDLNRLQGHSILDLGDDRFTVGRPHPMIDPAPRNERIVLEGSDPQVAVLLLDCVLGYGAHPDPAGAMAPSIAEAKTRARQEGRTLLVVASVTGTEQDPQGYARQCAQLRATGCRVMDSNYEAVLLAGWILRKVLA